MRISMTIGLQSFESCNKLVEPDQLQASTSRGISTQKQFRNSYTRQLSHRFQCKRLLPFNMLPRTPTMQRVLSPGGTKICIKLKTFLKSLTRIFDQEKTKMVIKTLCYLCHKLEPAQPLTATLLLKLITMRQYLRTLMRKMKTNLDLTKQVKATKVQKSN